MKNMSKLIFLLSVCLLTGLPAFAAENDCEKYAYNSSKKEAHIYESIPYRAYFGFTQSKDDPTSYRLAFCEVRSQAAGGPQLTYLHFTKADGTKGEEIPVTRNGELDWSLSICGTSERNTLIGGWGYHIEEHQYKDECSEGHSFDQVTLLPSRMFNIYTLEGGDTVIGVINQIHNKNSTGWSVLMRGGSGRDVLDADGGYYYYFNPYTPESVPAFSKIEGNTGDDRIYSIGNGDTWTNKAHDRCIGGDGNDLLVCDRDNTLCIAGPGKEDTCDCEIELSCEF